MGASVRKVFLHRDQGSIRGWQGWTWRGKGGIAPKYRQKSQSTIGATMIIHIIHDVYTRKILIKRLFTPNFEDKLKYHYPQNFPRAPPLPQPWSTPLPCPSDNYHKIELLPFYAKNCLYVYFLLHKRISSAFGVRIFLNANQTYIMGFKAVLLHQRCHKIVFGSSSTRYVFFMLSSPMIGKSCGIRKNMKRSSSTRLLKKYVEEEKMMMKKKRRKRKKGRRDYSTKISNRREVIENFRKW